MLKKVTALMVLCLLVLSATFSFAAPEDMHARPRSIEPLPIAQQF